MDTIKEKINLKAISSYIIISRLIARVEELDGKEVQTEDDLDEMEGILQALDKADQVAEY